MLRLVLVCLVALSLGVGMTLAGAPPPKKGSGARLVPCAVCGAPLVVTVLPDGTREKKNADGTPHVCPKP